MKNLLIKFKQRNACNDDYNGVWIFDLNEHSFYIFISRFSP